jgi:hypothetical protein
MEFMELTRYIICFQDGLMLTLHPVKILEKRRRWLKGVEALAARVPDAWYLMLDADGGEDLMPLQSLPAAFDEHQLLFLAN